MNAKQINDILIFKGFDEKRLDTGFNYTKEVNHNIELICYVEPDISVSFIVTYRWNDNEIKGTYDVSMKELQHVSPDVDVLFKKAVKNMPKYLGDRETGIHLHPQIETAIDHAFI